MKRTQVDRSYLRPKPVERIGLSERHVRVRIVLAALGVLVAIFCFAYGISNLKKTETGWNEISADAGKTGFASSYTFVYDLGSGPESAISENKRLTVLYSDWMAQAYRLFNPYETLEGTLGVHYLNTHPNTRMKLDGVLYEALSQMKDGEYLYLGPVWADFKSLFLSQSDYEAEGLDPLRNEGEAEFVRCVREFVKNGDVNVRLYEDGTAELYVSPRYLEFASEYEVFPYIDFYLSSDAFILDELGKRLEQNGLTRGYIETQSGMLLNLDKTGIYQLNFPNREGKVCFQTEYTGGMAAVALRTFPLKTGEDYYVYEDGSVRTPYADKPLYSGVLLYGEDRSLSELFIKAYALFMDEGMPELEGIGVQTIE